MHAWLCNKLNGTKVFSPVRSRLSPKGFTYWRRAFLPAWVQEIDYSSLTKWKVLLGGFLPRSHLGKSKLKVRQFGNQRSWIRSIGGCGSYVWADPPQGPPLHWKTRFRNKPPLEGAFSFRWIITKKLYKPVNAVRLPVEMNTLEPIGTLKAWRAPPLPRFSGFGRIQCIPEFMNVELN